MWGGRRRGRSEIRCKHSERERTWSRKPPSQRHHESSCDGCCCSELPFRMHCDIFPSRSWDIVFSSRYLYPSTRYTEADLNLYKKTSRLNSTVLTGYGSSNLCRTVGCKMPKTPMVWFLPARLILMDAAWPGRKVLSVQKMLAFACLPGKGGIAKTYPQPLLSSSPPEQRSSSRPLLS